MIALFALFLAPARADAPLYVQAQGLRLRATASPTSPAVAVVRVNTPVTLLAQEGDRVQVRLQGRPDDRAITGWIPADLLDEAPLSLGDALEAAAQAPDAEQTQRWLERAVAIDPSHPLLWVALADVATERGDLRVAAQARAQADGEAPVYLARCDGGRAELAARYTAKAGWEALTAGTWEGLADGALEPLRGTLALQTWYAAGPAGSQQLDGTPFARPFYAPIWNEDGGDAWAAGRDLNDEIPQDKLALGPCPEGADLLATAPLQALAAPWSTAQAPAALAGWTRDATDITARAAPVGAPELQATVPWTWWSCGDEAEIRPARPWALLREDGSVRTAVGADWNTAAGELAPVSVDDAGWYTLQVGDSAVTFAALHARWDLGDGLSLWTPGQISDHWMHVTLRSWGC